MSNSGFFKKLSSDLPKLIGRILIAVIAVALLLFLLVALGTLKGGKDKPEETPVAEEITPSEPETEAETETSTEPETETETETETEEETTTEAYSAEPREIVEIKSLGTSEIGELASKYDQEVKRYVIGYEDVSTDENNRPVFAADLLGTFEGTDAKLKVYCADENTPRAALSFMVDDDAPQAEAILDILKEKEVHAIFFVTHTFAAEHPDLIRRMIDEEHEIGNYSYTDPQEGVANLEPLDQVFEAFNMQRYMDLGFEYNMQRYCLNHGYWSQLSVMLASEMGYEVCFPSVNFMDDDAELSVEDGVVLEGLEKNLHNGAVYGFHCTNELVTRILPTLIDFIREQGFQVIPL